MRTLLFLAYTFMAVPLFAQSKRAVQTVPSTQEYVYATDNHAGRIWLERKTDSLYILHHEAEGKELSSWELPYPVYRFCCGNLTGDELPEIAVGVIKPTRYFKEVGKRLFLFKLFHGKLIRPLWLGSQVGLPLEDFHIEKPRNPKDCIHPELLRIRTVERKHDGTMVEGIYRYGGFGLKFEYYL